MHSVTLIQSFLLKKRRSETFQSSFLWKLKLSIRIRGTLISFSLSLDAAVRMAYLFVCYLSERLNGFFTVFQVLILTNIMLGIYLFGS